MEQELIKEVHLVCPFYIFDDDETAYPEEHYQHRHCRLFRDHGELCLIHPGCDCVRTTKHQRMTVEYHKRNLIERDKAIIILDGP